MRDYTGIMLFVVCLCLVAFYEILTYRISYLSTIPLYRDNFDISIHLYLVVQTSKFKPTKFGYIFFGVMDGKQSKIVNKMITKSCKSCHKQVCVFICNVTLLNVGALLWYNDVCCI